MLGWIGETQTGRSYLWHILCRILGLDKPCRGAQVVRHRDLAAQLEFLLRMPGSPINPNSVSALKCRVLDEIMRHAADEEFAPEPLRQWLQIRRRHEERISGALIAKRLWPDHPRCRQGFIFAAQHLSLVRAITKGLINRHRPREIARAIVNSLLKRGKQSAKSSFEVRALVHDAFGSQHFQIAAVELKLLATARIRVHERKDAPAKRLSSALEAFLRGLRFTSVAPSPRYRARIADALTEPWRRGEVANKVRLYRLWKIANGKFDPEVGPKVSQDTANRYARHLED